MKKRLKKIMVVVLLFTMIFTFSVRPKKADASVSMTLAGIAATVGGSAMLPYALGAAGILAVGGVIKNWDVVKDYGEKVIAKMGGYDAASGSYVQNPDGTATVVYSPAMKLAMAQAVNDVPAFVPVSAISYNVGSFTLTDGNNVAAPPKNVAINASGLSVGDQIIVDFTVNASKRIYISPLTSNGSVFSTYAVTPVVGVNRKIITVTSGEITNGYWYNGTIIRFNKSYALNDSISLSDVKITINRQAAQTVGTADTFGSVADNVNARLLGMNAAIADNQAVTISADAELLNASLDDLASISDATLTETQTQTGILSQIWQSIKAIPAAIVAAASSIPSSINANMDQLWEDAGAIWSGMSDTLTNIQTDVNAKIGAMQTAMSGGIDNIRVDIGTMMDNLSAGIDSFAASAAANWASWGQLTLDGIDAGVGAITSGLTNTWTNVTTAITDGVGALNTEIGKIVTFITDLPITLLRLIVPAEGTFSFKEKMAELARLLEQKFGSLDDLHAALGAMITPSGSIYQIEVSLLGRQYKIVPIFLKPTIDAARPFLTAALNLTSITFLIHRNKKELFK